LASARRFGSNEASIFGVYGLSALSDGNIMSSLASTEKHTATASTTSKVIQPAWVRVMHWINAVAIILMIMSGLQVYNASPLFRSLTFSPTITLGGCGC
jgi:thiosulfate reductase cytochrome b subunit